LSVFLDELVNQKQKANIKLTTLVDPSHLAKMNPVFYNLEQYLVPAELDDIDLQIELDEYISEELRAELLGESDDAKQARYLIALANKMASDGIVTNNPLLLKCRYTLYQYHRLTIIDHYKFMDTLDVIAVANEVYSSVFSDWENISLDAYYLLIHWKGVRLYHWYDMHNKKFKDDELREMIRSALLNRYSFVAYSRDMVLYGQVQKDASYRRGVEDGHSMFLNYHLTNFYLMLWGMLEHLTLIVNNIKEFDLKTKQCGIMSKKFWGKLKEINPKLVNLYDVKYGEWVGSMADMRHAAAHRTLCLPASCYEETNESKKTDQEIVDILKREGVEVEPTGSQKADDYMWSMRIYEWRLSKMKKIAPSLAFVRKSSGSYFRDPVSSVDYDFLRMNAVMDYFFSFISAR
ncbi:MAG: hypothetical protein KKC78_06795, partial [Proteobacteria bacterium]|nr:hypothetical protein [Pseudomonadota bacterium]